MTPAEQKEAVALERTKTVINYLTTLFPLAVIQVLHQIEALEVHAYVASATAPSRLAEMHQIHVRLCVPKFRDTQVELNWVEEDIRVSVETPLSFRNDLRLRPGSVIRSSQHSIVVRDDRLIAPWLSRTRTMIPSGMDIKTWAGLPIMENQLVVQACWEEGLLRSADFLQIDGSTDFLVLRPGDLTRPLILKKKAG
jgi:hypothetical protein